MQIANAQAIAKFLTRNRDVAKWMAAWSETTKAAHWLNLFDVRQDFPSADGVEVSDGSVVTVFNVKGNRYRLLTAVSYQRQIVRLLDLLTHAEYSKNKWKG